MPVPARDRARAARRATLGLSLALSLTLALPWSASPARAGDAPFVETDDGSDAFYCEERQLGYWFYCGKPAPPENTSVTEATPEQTAAERLEAVTGELRELKARAILEPTPANVTAYIRFQREQLDRASLFSDVWQRAIWQDPDLDYTLQRPVSTLGKRQWQDARSAERDATMAHLSERYGLFYFFAQSCGACQVMSPIVKSVAATWHITVRAVSTDGGPSEQFPSYSVETNQRSRMGLEPRVTPAVVLWDAATSRALPIGYGVMSADELQDRIYLLTSKDAGRDF
ncbi:conjugal transfer protein TraF [Novosphingobium sp. PC22D]|uniref:conjugal transfer protein TraF n=1 Tax=Novosphingobium sp. PC22D TaxID=1962403 RepID=UPI000BF08CCE|nr:conjugal transfer protein TraF [Novosphingobium sp. PC22D]PEQ10346.1 conjugal transfer protein TraF [Novosphingobium sp. PC22D]